MALDVSWGAAAFAGLLSFLSPCVLPLVPPYLVFISGVSLDDLKRDDSARASSRVMITALAFVLGFATVFVALGATASYVGQMLRDQLPLLARIAGIFIIIMGLHFLGVFKIAFLSREKRYQQSERPVGLLGAYAVGLAFAFGWTPCIGPVLAAILSIAASTESVTKGAELLFVYSLGLGIPFLISAAAINGFLQFFGRFKSKLELVEKTMGALLVVAGLMFLTGTMQSVSYWLLETFPVLQSIG
ncbi:cytochrome c biogenesis CcdA family protein [Aestuariivirga litoralis]|uniref:cytochrome c biogenesis CcdA family protein n=1 Tax=Aestuariivirga litoralis TaxID=2650924 RepID=UPI0018C4F0A3|nr:cytochrome c biogenesis protein CcdA [Aestuariivirga litoralis]MBG1233148.1 cytochrome c biogenesis protein CcdA [Aestuariivirga litoralis]